MELELWKVLTAALALGGSWGGAKVALNGTRERVKEVSKKLDEHIKEEGEADLKLHERMASVETKIDVLLDRSIR